MKEDNSRGDKSKQNEQDSLAWKDICENYPELKGHAIKFFEREWQLPYIVALMLTRRTAIMARRWQTANNLRRDKEE